MPVQRSGVCAAEVHVRAHAVARGGAVAPLQQNARRPARRPPYVGEAGHGRRRCLAAGECRPEGELPLEVGWRRIQAQRVNAAGPAGPVGHAGCGTRGGCGNLGGERRRDDAFPVPLRQAEREPAGALRDDEAGLGALDQGALSPCPAGGRLERLGLGVDVQVKMAAARAFPDPLYPTDKALR